MHYKFNLVFIGILFLFSCKKEDINAHRFLKPASFNKIELNNPFDVFLTESTENSIEITGNENRIQKVNCKVENGVLKISDESKGSWLSPQDNKIQIFIHSTPLQEITANETCNIKTMNAISSDEFGIILKSKANEANLELNCKSFYYWNNFPTGGKLILSGKVEFIKLWNFALMSVDAKNLNVINAEVENSSKGDCEVHISNSLKYSIKGTGNIQLYGNPLEIIEMANSSSGKLIKHN